jgi:hypothetical protein
VLSVNTLSLTQRLNKNRKDGLILLISSSKGLGICFVRRAKCLSLFACAHKDFAR